MSVCCGIIKLRCCAESETEASSACGARRTRGKYKLSKIGRSPPYVKGRAECEMDCPPFSSSCPSTPFSARDQCHLQSLVAKMMEILQPLMLASFVVLQAYSWCLLLIIL